MNKTAFATFGALALAFVGSTASAQNCNRACLRQHLDGYLAAVTRHKPEAGNVIDEEAQAVMVEAVFRRDPNSPKRRNHFTELFHLDHGKIRDIHACFYYPPDDRPVPNWPPYDGLFPLPASHH